MTDHCPARTDHGEGFAPWLVVIPVISLLMAGLLIMVLSIFVKAPSRPPTLSFSDGGEEIQVDQPVIDEMAVGEPTVRRAPAISR